MQANTALPQDTDGFRPDGEKPAFLSLRGIGKTYGSTRANDDLSLDIAPGEIVGLIGANGAGKSTLMRIVCGVTRPDEGSLHWDGAALDPDAFSARTAQRQGIRIVWQELSLCANLSVADNFYVERPELAGRGPLWRGAYHTLARESIEAIFPGARISTRALVADLSLSERQMVEIARVASDPALRLLILDEPTSSLGSERSAQLRAYVRRRAAEGLATIFISHKLAEVLDVSDRIVAMRNGRIVWQERAAKASVPDMVEAMGGPGAGDRPERQARTGTAAEGEILATLDGKRTAAGIDPPRLRRGEIVGLAGLEGNGQRAVLRALFSRPEASGLKPGCRVRYISGDRPNEGVFPLWTVLQNISIGRIAARGPFAPVRDSAERPHAASLAGRLRLDESRFGSKILELSGGNQQKALVARALADDFDVLLLDDPTRGVDIAAKRDFYRLVEDVAQSGRLVIWYSTEDLEFLECDRVLVFSKGRIIRELGGAEIDEDAIVASSFAEQTAAGGAADAGPPPARRIGPAIMKAIPFASLVAVFLAMSIQNPLVASSFGLELLLAPAVPLVLIALAQMFVVGGSEIDLGVGAFTGLVNVISATLLVASPLLGAAALVAGLAGYALIGVLIQARAIPAIVVTLGASFIWIGTGQTLQASPGGSSPEWLAALFSWSIPGLPTPLVLILLAGIAAILIDGSATGTILRGFGANAAALARAGWSPVRYAVCRYLVACVFAMAAGLYVTATNNASDINASSSFTLLSIAAVVMGGCQLLGGMIAPAGVVAGAVTLSLIGALLAALGVSTDFNAAVQGGLLILILGFQAFLIRRKNDA
ncbi:ATP-binding cassette domain-containing protein [Shinella pollutisoli]|uniref:ATP-binding cassette domain-containing protein n=1 Tax=Shinella pollutisoli TaxID=2250594 RepID=A0ABV7DBY9_9HYPH|nr:ATP-binding cassette domain-containing protein [Shinella pollutisoli]